MLKHNSVDVFIFVNLRTYTGSDAQNLIHSPKVSMLKIYTCFTCIGSLIFTCSFMNYNSLFYV